MNVRSLALLFLFAACQSKPAPTEGAIGFDAADDGWNVASTGGRGPHASWQPLADRDAVSPPNVIAVTAIEHDSEERFNLYWTDRIRFQDGRLSVAVRADDGEIDQGGGPMWRVQDANNYYVCRFNPLERNYRVYVVHDGVRHQLETAIANVGVHEWHRIEVEHAGDRITCWLDGKKLLEATDGRIAAAGGVGLWTKADARTSFDDLLVAPR